MKIEVSFRRDNYKIILDIGAEHLDLEPDVEKDKVFLREKIDTLFNKLLRDLLYEGVTIRDIKLIE